jgi:hypothetical protein
MNQTSDRPVGDVNGMRERAWQLRAQADRILPGVQKLLSELDHAEYECPLADRQRATMRDIAGRVGAAAQSLNDLAGLLLRRANSLEQGH